MRRYVVTPLGEPRGASVIVEAPNDFHAVAEVAGCAVNFVPIAHRREGHRRPWYWEPGGRDEYEVRYYMLLDLSGRQYEVRDAEEERS